MHNVGYDVENYTMIDPIFGTMKDFEELVAGVKKRGSWNLINTMPNIHVVDSRIQIVLCNNVRNHGLFFQTWNW